MEEEKKDRKKKRPKDIRIHILCYILAVEKQMKKKRVSRLFNYSPPAIFYIIKKMPLYILTDDRYLKIYLKLKENDSETTTQEIL